jgi:hypothetical protein
MLLSMASFMWSEQVKWRGVAWCGVWCVMILTFVLSSPDFVCHVKFFLNVFHIVCSFLCLRQTVAFLSLQYMVLYTEVKN